MNKYIIRKSPSSTVYFTSASSYDVPRWVSINEATKYESPELANQAALKLIKYGSYQVKLSSLTEAMSFEFPNGDTVVPGEEVQQNPGNELSDMLDGDDALDGDVSDLDDESSDAAPEDEMQADDQEEPCGDCGNEPCTCDGDQTPEDDESESDDLIDDDMSDDVSLDDDGVVTDDELGDSIESEYDELGMSFGNKQRMGETATMPAKPPLDAKPSENNTTAATQNTKIPKQIDAVNNTSVDFGGDPDDTKVTVPSEVKSELKALITTIDKRITAHSDGHDDESCSFDMTCSAAFGEILKDITVGTVGSIKKAQVYRGTLMNPITSLLPTSVVLFLNRGGAKPTLKNLFDSKWESKKLAAKREQL